MNEKYDLVVVGGGILGTFHTYHASKKGLRVALFEKDMQPQGATVRNFGQVVPSGMNTKWQRYGRESLRIYGEIQSKMDISVRQEGSVYIASNEEEVKLLEELAVINKKNNYRSILLSKSDCMEKYPGLRPDYARLGLFFPEEIIVEPATMVQKIHTYLKELGTEVYMNAHVLQCESLADGVHVHFAGGKSVWSAKVIVCNGSDFKTLYPEVFAKSDLVVSKLQMMQTVPQSNYRLPGAILTGLSIRRYEAFEECPSYTSIKAKENKEAFENKWGVHILFKQAVDGSVILGDSHQYASAVEMDSLGYDLRTDVDNFILQEAKKIIDLPTYVIKNRWFGMYSQCATTDIFNRTMDRNIHIITGIGGKGMTGSAGYSEENINTIFNF